MFEQKKQNNKLINNELYEKEGGKWWHDDNSFYTLRTSVNPVRVGYIRKKIGELGLEPAGKKALEVGSGGGILTEEIAKMGFITTGIEPADNSLKTAREHARISGLEIQYDKGTGESMPYADNNFDLVVCCDVLEHVEDVNKVVAEISRVLKPGGAFIFDTFNRTLISKLVVIKIWQDWKRWAFMESNAHIWNMFITPKEMRRIIENNYLQWKDFCGTKPSIPVPKLIGHMRKRAKGEWTFKQFADSFRLLEDKDMAIMYLGFAVKRA